MLALLSASNGLVMSPGATTIFGYSAEEAIGRNVTLIMPSEVARNHDSHIDTYLHTGEAKIIGIGREVEGRRRDGSRVPLELNISRAEVDGRTLFTGILRDITERKRQEQRTKVISDELDHRVKNILSLVTSIAGLSGRNARSVPEFRENFEARIQALARAHQTLADGNWDGMSMRRLVENELGPYAQLPCSRITIEGPAVELSARSAQPVSLVVHELATNAVKHGALSIPDGTISITWGFEGADGSLALKWVEDGLSGLEAPAQRGFGSTVITRAVEGQCDASVDLDFAPTGLHYRLSLPAKTLRMQDTRNLVTSEC